MVSLKRWFYFLALLFPFANLAAEFLEPPPQFSTQYCYYRAQGLVVEADRDLREFQIQIAHIQYENAKAYLECSHVDDPLLSFRIEIGLIICDQFNSNDRPLMRKSLTELFNKFTSNPSPDKIEFDSLEVSHDYQSFPEAQ